MPVFGQDGFRMELYAFNVQGFMAHPHDFVDVAIFVLRPGGDFKAARQGGLFDDEGMIARCSKRVGQASKNTSVVMINLRGFTMHNALGMDDIAAERITDALVAQAYA